MPFAKLNPLAKFSWLVAGILFLVSPQSMATDQEKELASTSEMTATYDSVRESKKIGFYTSILGDPLAIIGVNGAYNITDFARANLGLGYLGAVTVGAGIKLMVPGWAVTPVVGMNGLVAIGTVDSDLATGSGAYANFGLDFTADSGFNLGAGLNVAVTGSGALPYLNIGYFF